MTDLASLGDPMQQLLAGMDTSDPRTRLILEMISKNRQRETPRAAIDRLIANYRDLRDAYERLRTRDRQLALALGACPRCWGEEPGCPHCDGRGAPGGLPATAELFEQFVRPVLRGMGGLTPTWAGDAAFSTPSSEHH